MSKKSKIIFFSVLIVIVVLFLILLNYFSQVLGLVIISAIESYLFLPLVKTIEKKLNRTVSIFVCLGGFLIVNGGIIYLLAPVFVKQTEHLINVVPAYYETISSKFNIMLEKMPELKEFLQNINLSENAIERLNVTISKISPAKLVSFFSTSLLIPVLMFYFLRDREKISRMFMFAIPSKFRSTAANLIKDINRQLRDYIYGEFIVVLVVSTVMAVALGIFKFEYWLILGILMGIFNIIPYIGPVLGSIPIILVALPEGINKVILALVLIVFVQQIDNLIIQPHIISESVKIHPAIVLICVLLGNCIGNIFGMILAVPAFIVLRILFKDIYKAFLTKNYKNKQIYQNNIL